ncbi:LysR family transcriptional regulator [Paenarthrobacter sp. DKR-5]|uniref:LysR substrate-binding domain-containing protein n=1 Tax=Paenarthrobacter sp. DKR-5 TaxID=2835535 RepID=UPI001BDBD1BC|nr:LysR substrate-binding domain-containing protein [Paenarthrobacter sp. DKR-5]MBT1002022.1 LysR family transcriptional regulator [Paenarthrobacter sp. DKR-5]
MASIRKRTKKDGSSSYMVLWRDPKSREQQGLTVASLTEELHFGRAAKRLCVAQPTLSRQIQTLVAQIGVRLLTRGPRGGALTDAGRELHEEGDRLLEQSMRTVDRARRAGRGELGHVSVGFIGSAVGLAVGTVARMRVRYPEVSFSLAERPFRDPLAGPDAGEDDLVLVRNMIANDVFELVDLANDESCLVVPTDHRLAAQTGVTRAELERLGDEVFLSTSRWMGLWGFQPRRMDEVASTQATLRLIASGVGISLMPSGYESQA